MWRGGRKKRRGKEEKKEREENEDLDEGGGRPSAGLCREKVTVFVAHTWMYCQNCNSHHLSDCIGHSEGAETWQLHALAEEITSCPE